MKYLTAIVLVLGLTAGIPICAQQGAGNLQIIFQLQMDGKPLVLENARFRTTAGDSLYIDLFRFYVSALQLQQKGAVVYSEKDSYHLVDAEEAGTINLVLKNVPSGIYDGFLFKVGTDSLINVSGAMDGDLDPTKGMYWAWNSGYINFKIEGRSPVCKTPHQVFEFHIGGYLPPNQTVRSLVLPLKNIRVAESGSTTVVVKVDLANFFRHLDLKTTNQVLIPSKTAAQLADYFTTVFSTE